mmetsp:Transcript_126080/g.247192  ORF Transcript_126080/g.247192 Transcript_126080/m.247192 type:complete len:247 (+) Transcript_126080:1-741(+)
MPRAFYPPPGLHSVDAASTSGERTPDFMTNMPRPGNSPPEADLADGAATPRGCAQQTVMMGHALKDRLQQLERRGRGEVTREQQPSCLPAAAPPSLRKEQRQLWASIRTQTSPLMTMPPDVPPPPPSANVPRRAPHLLVSVGSVGHPFHCAAKCDPACINGAQCPRCHLCIVEQPAAEQSAEQAAVHCPSVGSLGHPKACAEPCKYILRGRGCKDGSNCTRCHLCRWSRHRSKHARRTHAAPSFTG